VCDCFFGEPPDAVLEAVVEIIVVACVWWWCEV
jgi:hypothetical protein